MSRRSFSAALRSIVRARMSLAFVAVSAAAVSNAQQPTPVLKYNPPQNFYKSASITPDDYTSFEVNAGIQIYPFRPFTGNIQAAWQQTLLRDWINPQFRESNVATQPMFLTDQMPGAQAVFIARFIENVAGFPREHLRTVIVAGGQAAIVDVSAAGGPSWQRITPAVEGLFKSLAIATEVAPPPVAADASPAARGMAGIYIGTKQRFMVNLLGPVGSGTFQAALHFYLFSADGRVYRTFDVQSIPRNGSSGFDFSAAARSDPDNSGQFAVEGDQLRMKFGGQNPETLRTTIGPGGGFSANGVSYVRQ